MTLIPVESLGTDSLRSGTLSSVFPELYELESIVEIQAWHEHQTVLDHSIKSSAAYDRIIGFDYLPADAKSTLDQYLNKMIGRHSRKALLRIAVMLHDIGKLTSLQQGANGQTSSPSHGVIGGWTALPLVRKIDIDSKEQTYILELIGDHLLPSDLLELAINNHWEDAKVADLLVQHRRETAIDLILLAYADWLGCDIRPTVQEERNKRVRLAHTTLSFLAQKNTP